MGLVCYRACYRSTVIQGHLGRPTGRGVAQNGGWSVKGWFARELTQVSNPAERAFSVASLVNSTPPCAGLVRPSCYGLAATGSRHPEGDRPTSHIRHTSALWQAALALSSTHVPTVRRSPHFSWPAAVGRNVSAARMRGPSITCIQENSRMRVARQRSTRRRRAFISPRVPDSSRRAPWPTRWSMSSRSSPGYCVQKRTSDLVTIQTGLFRRFTTTMGLSLGANAGSSRRPALNGDEPDAGFVLLSHRGVSAPPWLRRSSPESSRSGISGPEQRRLRRRPMPDWRHSTFVKP